MGTETYNVYRKNYSTNRLIDGPQRPSNPYPVKAVAAPYARYDTPTPMAVSNKLYNYIPYAPTQMSRKTYTPNANLANYNDKTQVNSFGDILSRGITGIVKANDWTDRGNTALQFFKDTWNVVNNYTLQPLLKGEFGTMGKNFLVNIGESMDMLGAAQVKGLFQDGWEGVKKATLWDEKNGRTNYDVDTGNLGLDIAGEILADPMNWISFGGWAVAKQSVNALADTAKVAAKATNAVDDAIYKKIAKQAVKGYTKGDFATVDTAMRSLATAFEKNGRIALKKVPKTPELIGALDNVVKASGIYKSNQVLDSVHALVKPTEDIQRLMNKAVLTSTGIYPTAKVVGAGVSWGQAAAANRRQNAFKKAGVLTDTGNINPFKFEEAVTISARHGDVEDFAAELSNMPKPYADAFVKDFNDSLYAHMNKIQQLRKQYPDYSKFNEELGKYFGLAKNVDALDSYIDKLKAINGYTNSKYLDMQKLLEDYKTVFKIEVDTNNTINNVLQFRKLSKQVDDIEQNVVNKLFKNKVYDDNGIKKAFGVSADTPEDIIDRVAVDALPSLEESLEDIYKYTQSKISKAKVSFLNEATRVEGLKQFTNADSIIEDISSVLLDYKEELVDYITTAMKTPGNIMAVGYKDGIMKFLDDYFNALDKQLNTDFKRALEHYMETGSGKFPQLDLNKMIKSKNVREAVLKFGDPIRNSYSKYRLQLEDLSNYKRYNNLDDLLHTADSAQESYIKKFIEKNKDISKPLQKTKDTLPVSKNKITSTVSSVQKIITDGTGNENYLSALDDFAQIVTSEGGGHPDVIKNALFNFNHYLINEAPEDFSSAYEELDRVLNSARSKITSRFTRTIEDGRVRFKTIDGVPMQSDAVIMIDKLLAQLDTVNPIKVTDGVLNMSMEGKYKTLKLEQTHTSLELLNIPENLALLNDIAQNTGDAGRAIRDLVSRPGVPDDVKAAARAITEVVDPVINYSDFVTAMLRANIDPEWRTALLSVIQKQRMTSPQFLQSNMNWMFDNIVEDAGNFLYGEKGKHSLSLEDLMNNNDGLIRKRTDNLMKKQFGDKAKTMQHTAMYDAVGNRQVAYELLPELKEHANEYAQVFFDTETTGFKWQQAGVFEIGWTDLDGNGHQINKQLINDGSPFNIPSDAALDVFYDNANPKYSKLTHKEKLDLFLKERSGEFSEKDMFINFIDNLKEMGVKKLGYVPDNEDTVASVVELVGHNILGFDNKMLLNRMKAVGVPDEYIYFYNRVHKVDTLEMLRKTNGLPILDADSKEVVKRIFTQYVNKQTSTGAINIVDTGTSVLRRNYSTLEQFYKAQADAGDQYAKIIYDTIHNANKAIQDKLIDIRDTNKALKEVFLTPQAFEDGTYLKYYTDLVRSLDIPEEKKVALLASSHMNSTKMLYSPFETDVHKYGVKNTIDTTTIKEWFNVSNSDVLDATTARAYTTIGNMLDKAKARISNPYPLMSMRDDIKQALLELMPRTDGPNVLKTSQFFNGGVKMIDLETQLPSFYHALRSDKSDVLSDFVMLQYVYNIYKNKGIMTDLIESKIPTNVLDMLNFSDAIYAKQSRATRLTNMLERANTVYKDQERTLNKAKVYKDIAQDFRENVVDSVRTLGKDLDKTNLYDTKSQVLANALQPVVDMLDNISEAITKGSVSDEFVDTTLRAHFDNIAKAQTAQVLQLPPIDLRNLMATNAPIMRLSNMDVKTNKDIAELMTNVLKRKAEYEQLGIKIHVADDVTYMYLTKDNVLDFRYDSITRKFRYELNDEFIDSPILKPVRGVITDLKGLDIINDVENCMTSLEKLSEGAANGSVGVHISSDSFKELYNNLPDEILKDIIPIDMITKQEMFTGNRFDFTNLGSASGRKAFDEFYSSNSALAILNNAELTAKQSGTAIQYTQLYYSDLFSINNGFLKTASDAEITAMLKANPAYVLTALVEDKKFGYKNVKINLNAKDAIADARRLNAVIMPYQTFTKTQNIINYNMLTESKSKIWDKIVYTYKMGMLVRPGVALRNMFDSTMKNMIETETFVETLKKEFEAHNLVNTYDKIVNDVMNLSYYDIETIKQSGIDPTQIINASLNLKYQRNVISAQKLIDKCTDISHDILKMDANRVFSRKNLDFYFEYMNPEIDKDVFIMVDKFIKSGPSAGMTATWEKFYADKFSKAAKGDATMFKRAWNTFMDINSSLMKFNSSVEQSCRLAEYMMLAERGMDNTSIFQKIAKTHFDYSDKSKFAKTVENVIPFYNFTMKNIEYWLDAMDEHPWIFRLITEMYGPMWDLDNINQREFDQNKSLEYQLLSGNVPLSDSGLTLKLSPSFMDVFNLFTSSPSDTIDSKTLPLFKIPTQIRSEQERDGKVSKYYNGKTGKWEETTYKALPDWQVILNNMPYVGPTYQAVTQTAPRYYERTGNPLNLVLPSVFGATKRWDEAPKKVYDKKPRVYTRPRKPYSGYKKSYGNGSGYDAYYNRTYYKKFYPKKSYTPASYRPWGMPDTPIKGRSVAPTYYPNFKSAQYGSGFYKKHYTKNGISKIKMSSKGVNKNTVQQHLQYVIRFK